MLEGQKTLLTRTMHDIRYDAIHDEIVVPSPLAQAILVYRGGANGEEAPLRVIQGPHTQLSANDYAALDKLEIDPVHNEILVPTLDSISIYPREGNGDVPPLRVIKGPDTQLKTSWTTGMGVAADPVHNLIIAGITVWRDDSQESRSTGENGEGSLLIFNRTDKGNVKPRAVIHGPKTGMVSLAQLQTYPPKAWIVATVQSSFVGIWSVNDNGDVPPRWKIAMGKSSYLKRPRGVALDPKNKEIMVADGAGNSILTFYFPEMF